MKNELSTAFLDRLMRGKLNWADSPTHLYDLEVRPHVDKLSALFGLFSCGGHLFLEDGWSKEWAARYSRGFSKLFEETIDALVKFEAELPERIKKMVEQNIAKALREKAEVDTPKKKEPDTDPKTIESYRSSIEQLLGTLEPATRAKMLSELTTAQYAEA